jgi:protein gp37
MGEQSKIQWTDHTFNPWIGCMKVSAGCKNCYAEQSTPVRVSRSNGLELWGAGAARRPASEAMWKEPLKWNREAEAAGTSARVFCASLADVFEDRVDLDEHRVRLFDLIRRTPWLDWQLLTKRPQNVLALLTDAAVLCERASAGFDDAGNTAAWLSLWLAGHAPSNVWLGTTVENQEAADERIPRLLEVPAVVRFLSVEPMLGPVDLHGYMWPTHWTWDGRFKTPEAALAAGAMAHRKRQALVLNGTPFVDWVIVGGESGPRARPFNIAWARSIVAQCDAADVPCFVKQMGARPTGEWPARKIRLAHPAMRDVVALASPKGGDMDEWPEDLRVRQMPTSKAEAERDPWEHNPGARPMPHPGAK